MAAERMKGQRKLNRAGITLVEIMISMAIMSIGVIGMVGAFKFFNVGVQSAKTRSLANNIAQERIEYLKNKSYYRLLATMQVSTDTRFTPEMVYDAVPNGEETVNVGGINFLRRVRIRKVNEDPNRNLRYMEWNEPDTGLKEIEIMVGWFERGEWRSIELRNLRENPLRVNKNCVISGSVTISGGGALQGAVVRAQESPSYYGVTGANGAYSFSIIPGTYTLLATHDQYFPGTLSSFGINPGTSISDKNFSLTRRDYGYIYGYAYLPREKLVVSAIVGSTNTDTGDTEWVEVYNPTTWTWTMSDGLGTGGNERVFFRYREAGMGADANLDFDYRASSVAPGHYFLFANTGTVSAAGRTVAADAVWSTNGTWADQDDVIQTDTPSHAGVIELKESSGRSLDTVGWYVPALFAGAGWTFAIPQSYEASAIYYKYPGSWPLLNDNGLTPDTVFKRRTRYGWNAVNSRNTAEAPCYDSNMNYADFDVESPVAYGPYNSESTHTCTALALADGAVVFVDDGMSAPVTASSWNGYFFVNNISTGVWTVYLSSGGVFTSSANYSAICTWGGGVPCFGSTPGDVLLSTPTTFGYVTGRVTDVLGNPLPNIKMFAAGSQQVSTNWNGEYTLPVEAGIVTVKANYQSQSPLYVELSSSDVNVAIGQAAKGVNFSLYQGGRIRGRVTTNGTDPLPGIPVVGLRESVEYGSAVSDGDGYFTISGTGVSTGTYVVIPQLEAGESASPSSTTVTVVAGLTAFASTYTVSGAFGYVTGSVTRGGSPITTGVMVYVTTATLAANASPPDITPTLRAGTGVYYAASSSAVGTYTVPVKGGYTYNVYSWFTTWTTGGNPVPTTTRRDYTGVVVAPNATVTRNFAW